MTPDEIRKAIREQVRLALLHDEAADRLRNDLLDITRERNDGDIVNVTGCRFGGDYQFSNTTEVRRGAIVEAFINEADLMVYYRVKPLNRKGSPIHYRRGMVCAADQVTPV